MRLQAKLSPNEANTLTAAPTQNAEAYDLFLKGEYEEREAEGSLRQSRSIVRPPFTNRRSTTTRTLPSPPRAWSKAG